MVLLSKHSMRHWLPSFDYPPLKEGYWLPVTSTINWCEEDFYATIYIAEIINTSTNLLFFYLGLKGIMSCLKYGHDHIFLISFIGYSLIGLGSFCFHATLKYPMQLFDELSMIYTICIMCYATFSFSQHRFFRQTLGTGLIGLAVFITIFYHVVQDPLFHQVAFGVLTAAVVFRSIYVMEVDLRNSLRTTAAKRANVEGREKDLLKQMWLMIGASFSTFLGGFVIWNIDNEYCSTSRRWRRQLGLPWGILLEGHGWWHLMTGIGAYIYLVWSIWLRYCLSGRQDKFELHWGGMFFPLPEVVPIQSSIAKRVPKDHASHRTQKAA